MFHGVLPNRATVAKNFEARTQRMYVRYEGHLLKKEVHFLPVLQKRDRKTSFILMRLKFLQQNLESSNYKAQNIILFMILISLWCPVEHPHARQI